MTIKQSDLLIKCFLVGGINSMSRSITKLFLYPLFRFFFWSVAAFWLIFLGISSSGLIRWIDFLLSLVFLGTAIEYAVKSVAYYKKEQLNN